MGVRQEVVKEVEKEQAGGGWEVLGVSTNIPVRVVPAAVVRQTDSPPRVSCRGREDGTWVTTLPCRGQAEGLWPFHRALLPPASAIGNSS